MRFCDPYGQKLDLSSNLLPKVLDIVRALASRDIERSVASFAVHLYAFSCKPNVQNSADAMNLPERKKRATDSSFSLIEGKKLEC